MNWKIFWTGVILVLIVLLAGWFRVYDIQNYPAGLFPDEAANGEDALLILEGDTRPFYPRGNGREGLFFYLEALSIYVFGIGVWQLHIVAALIGVLTVFSIYFATRVWFGRLSGLGAALLLATNHWHVTMSRTGFRAILIPLMIALFTAFAGFTIQSVKKKQKIMPFIYAALAGLSFGGGFYTYIAYRVMIGVVVGVFAILLLAAIHPKIGFPHFKRYGSQLLVGVLFMLIALAPLGLFFFQNPDAFVGRAGQVSVFNEELQAEYGGGTLAGTVFYSTKETLLSFFTGTGDLNWRHNVAGFPLLNPLVGVLFLLGLTWTIRGFFMVLWKLLRGEEVHLGMIYPYLLLILVGMLAPVIATAEGLPHGLRSIGLVLPIFMLAGVAGAVSLRWCLNKFKGTVLAGVCVGTMIGLLALGAIYDGSLYFLIARNDVEAHYDYRSDLPIVADFIKDYVQNSEGEAKPYLVLEGFSLQSIHFLLSVKAHDYLEHPDVDEHIYTFVNADANEDVTLKVGEIIVFTQSTIDEADKYAQKHADVRVIESKSNRFGEEVLRVYGIESAVEGVLDTQGNQYGLDAG